MMTRKDGLEVSSTVPGLGWTSNGFKLLSYKKHSALSLHCTNGLSFPLKIILIAALRPGIYYGCCIAGQIVLCTNPVSLHITVSVICTVSMKNFQQITVMNCGLFLGSVHLLIVKKKKKLTWSYSLPFYVRSHLEAEFYYMCFHPGILFRCQDHTGEFLTQWPPQGGV